MRQEGPIGFLDSGMGGLTIASEVVKLLPGEEIIYYGDNLHIPYGPKPQSEIREYVLTIIDYLVNVRGAKYVVIACNTATVAALEAAQDKFAVPVVGPVVDGAMKAVQLSKNQKIGLLATEGTVNSNGYQDAIHQLNPDAQVVAIPAPKLVLTVEKGQLEGPETEAIVYEYLQPILDAGCDSVILGCTHFPFLTDVIRKVSKGQLEIIFSGTEIAEHIQIFLQEQNLFNPAKKGKEICLTSQLANVSEEFLEIGRQKLGMRLQFTELNLFEHKVERFTELRARDRSSDSRGGLMCEFSSFGQ